jgi:hypothetical protein
MRLADFSERSGYRVGMGKQDDPRRDLWWFLATGDLFVGPLIDRLLGKSSRTGWIATVAIFVLVVALCCLIFI